MVLNKQSNQCAEKIERAESGAKALFYLESRGVEAGEHTHEYGEKEGEREAN